MRIETLIYEFNESSFVQELFLDDQIEFTFMEIYIRDLSNSALRMNVLGANACDFGAAWSFQGFGHLLSQADIIWHSSLTKASSGGLTLYYGIGGRVVFSSDPNVGLRLPIGLDYIFSSAPIDIFVEVVPTMDFVPDTDFQVNGGIGIRFWL